MLEKVRKPGRGKSILAYFIFGAICLVFIFFNMTPGDTGFGGGGTAAVVNSEVISIADFREVYDRLEKMRSAQMNSIPAARRQEVSQRMRQEALEELINRELMAQAAFSVGMVVADAEIGETITSIPAFQENGRFQRTRYDNYLRAVQQSPGAFENKLRKDLAVNRLRGAFYKAMAPLPSEADKDKEVRETKLNFEFVRFQREDVKSKMDLPASQVEAFLQDEKGQLKVKEYYSANKAEFTEPEQTRARHILIMTSGDAETDKKALAKATDLFSQSKSGNFADLAKKHSEDPGSKDKGGDLGFFPRGRMTKAFEDAAFAAKVGEVVGPVKTEHGYHIIKVEERKEGGLRSLEEVSKKVARQILLDEKFNEAMDKIRQGIAQKQPAAVAAVVGQLGLKWDETGDFSIGQSFIPKVGDAELAMGKILAVKQKGDMSDVVKLHGDDYLFRLKEHKAPSAANPTTDPFSSMQFLTVRRANDAFNTWASEEKKTARIKRNSQLF